MQMWYIIAKQKIHKWCAFSKITGKLEYKAITLKQDYDQGYYLPKNHTSDVF